MKVWIDPRTPGNVDFEPTDDVSASESNSIWAMAEGIRPLKTSHASGERGGGGGGRSIHTFKDAAWATDDPRVAGAGFGNGRKKASWFRKGHFQSPANAEAAAFLAAAKIALNMDWPWDCRTILLCFWDTVSPFSDWPCEWISRVANAVALGLHHFEGGDSLLS